MKYNNNTLTELYFDQLDFIYCSGDGCEMLGKNEGLKLWYFNAHCNMNIPSLPPMYNNGKDDDSDDNESNNNGEDDDGDKDDDSDNNESNNNTTTTMMTMPVDRCQLMK